MADVELYVGDDKLDCVIAGVPSCTRAELVFCTSHSGYVECCTDPSYAGQALVLTSALVGAHGVPKAAMQSAGFQPALIVCANPAPEFVSFVLQLGGCCAIVKSVRHLVRAARHGAVMTASRVKLGASSNSAMLSVASDPRVIIADFGCKTGLAGELLKRGMTPEIISARDADAVTKRARSVRAVLLSNGPGDPSADARGAALASSLISAGCRVAGVCYGHQLLCIASGMRVSKMPVGHRGANHPVRATATGELLITSHNHGYAVAAAPRSVVTHFSVLDGTVEGVRTSEFMSVQFHPEGCPGPRADGVMDTICDHLRGHSEQLV